MSKSRGNVEVEIFRAWHGCKWVWCVYLDHESVESGVEESYIEALMAVQVTLDNMEVDG